VSLHDSQGVGFIDATAKDVQYAWRQCRRAPVAVATIVGTVGLGLGLVAAIFTILNAFLFRIDAVRAPEELFAVERRTASDEPVSFTYRQYESLATDTTAFSAIFAEHRGVNTRLDGRVMDVRLVTGNYFQMLGVAPELGRLLTPDDEGRSLVVLSHDAWSRSFGSDPQVVGRSIAINGVPYEVVGVAPERFRGLLISEPDYWAPLSIVSRFRPALAGKERDMPVEIVGRLKPGVSTGAATAQLAAWAERLDVADPNRSRGLRAGLRPRQGTLITDAGEVVAVFVPLFLAFGLILLIACANVTNLLLARGMSRQREIGIRLSVGASRKRIVRQLLTESLVLALAAAALGFGLSRLILAGVMFAVSASLPPEIVENVAFDTPPADWRVIVFLAGGALAATAFFGLAPALQATRLELVRTMRGETSADARPSRARNLLIALQVGASTLLLISAAIFLRSAVAASASEIGFRTADTLGIEIETESQRAAVVRAVSDDPITAAVAASWPPTLAEPVAAFANASKRVPMIYRYASAGYFDVLDIDVVRGRGFDSDERSVDSGVIVVSESLARELWPDGSALGQTVRLEADPRSEERRLDRPMLPSRAFTIIGIVRDVTGPRIARWRQSAAYLPIDAQQAKASLIVRVHGDSDRARQALFDRLAIIDPAIGDISTLRAMAGAETYILGSLFWGAVILGGLALALTVSGLFSVLSYLVEQRAKEIGVRMALGATAQVVTRMVLSQLLGHVGIGITVGAGLAAGLTVLLLALGSTDAALITDVVHVVDPAAYASSLLFIAASCMVAAWIPARRAAAIDPIVTLRED
jgi:predicted permease